MRACPVALDDRHGRTTPAPGASSSADLEVPRRVISKFTSTASWLLPRWAPSSCRSAACVVPCVPSSARRQHLGHALRRVRFIAAVPRPRRVMGADCLPTSWFSGIDVLRLGTRQTPAAASYSWIRASADAEHRPRSWCRQCAACPSIFAWSVGTGSCNWPGTDVSVPATVTRL